MATRGEIRQGVRSYLGEPGPVGTWSDDEIHFFIQEAGNEHAKRAYSVKTIIYTSSIQNVRDYAFPPNFGDLLSVRYRDESIQDEWGLDYVDKDVLRNYSYVGAELGDPYYYYREQDSFGLFPVPNKPLVVEHVFENDCPGFTEIYDRTPAADRTVTRSVDIPVSVVLLVDNSGSMGGNSNRLVSAKAGMRQVLDDLNANDRLGIITFGRTTETVVDISAPFDRTAALAAIDAIEADGDTRMLPGLEAAQAALRDAATELKLVILLSDGDRTDPLDPFDPSNTDLLPYANFYTLAGAMHAAGIRIDTVGTGESVEAFLRGLASAGGGEYHFAANPQTIPDIFDGSLTVRHVRRNVPNPNPPEFTNLFDLQVVPDPSEPMTIEVRDTDLDPRCVWVSTVSLYLRRAGSYFPGNMWLSLTNLKTGFVHTSGEIAIDSINSQPEWVHFDFTQNPITIDPTETTYRLQIHTDAAYRAVEPRTYGGEGILVGTETVNGAPQAFFQMHRLRHDLEVEYYKNVCDLMTADDAVFDIPDRYTETIVKMVLEKCYLKGGYDTQLAAFWHQKAEAEIKEAKAQAVIPTLGKRRELRRSAPRLGNLTYNNATGLFRLRMGRP